MRDKLERLADSACDWLDQQARKTAWEIGSQKVDFITKYALIILIVLALITTMAQIWIRMIKPFM